MIHRVSWTFVFIMSLYLIPQLVAQTSSDNSYKGFCQDIKGMVVDKVSHEPLFGAHVVLLNMEVFTATSADEKGSFVLRGIPIGRVSIQVSYLGYQSTVLSNLILGTGQVLVLWIELEEAMISAKEVEIVANQDKYKPLNRMATVSARSFSVEESQRFAGARNDVSRMASNFAGVNQGNDSRNDIIIRGNSPMGLLWRYEGVDIPNPNHYGAMGSTGGPVSILNNNVLSNSDFYTGAFPSEYGNALSGVFDLNMRHGDTEKHRFLGQIGFNGLELMAEGPINKKQASSYLISYRYSTMAVFAKLGADFGTGTAVPEYQDLTLKLHIPTQKWGIFSLFAIGGISSIDILKSDADSTEIEENMYAGDNEDLYNDSKLGVVGLSNTYMINKTSFAKLTLAASYHDFLTRIDSISQTDYQPKPAYRNNFQESKLSAIFYVSKRINIHHNFKVGMIGNQLGYHLLDSVSVSSTEGFRILSDYKGTSWQFQPYLSWQYKPSEKWTINAGLHYLYYSFNGTQSVEPRLGLRYQLNQSHSFSIAYGLHSQTQPFTSYIYQTQLSDGNYLMYNKNLDLLKSHHFVIGYDWVVNEFIHLKLESYYQSIYNVAVNASVPDSYSILNQGADFWVATPDSMNNEGTGVNYGIELTVEQFLNRGFYYLLTSSLYESTYKGSDDKEYNTAFNGHFIVNALLGKEIGLNKNKTNRKSVNTLSFDIKATYAGGKRYTPIDSEKTVAEGKPVYVEEESFEKQFDDYFRLDIRAGFRQEFKKFSMEFSIDAQNIFDIQNVYLQRVNTKTGEVSEYYQLGRLIIPQFVIHF